MAADENALNLYSKNATNEHKTLVTKGATIAANLTRYEFSDMTQPRVTESKQKYNANQLLAQAESIRLKANSLLNEDQRKSLGQFMTPQPVAQLMASMFDNLSGDLQILDAGAGVGSLTCAVIDEALSRVHPPRKITAHTYEVDTLLAQHLKNSMDLSQQACIKNDCTFIADIQNCDFIEQASMLLRGDLFSKRLQPRFNLAILNPPYYKINSQSLTRKRLRDVGIETVNLYAAFVALAIKLLEPEGELVAITPRSFCNGPYFKPFRQLLLSEMSIKKIHIFESRNKAFKGDDVLQENIIFHAVKRISNTPITITSSACAENDEVLTRKVPKHEVVCPNDPELFIHIAATNECGVVASKARSFPCSLEDLGIQVSTGRVVDFRARNYLRMNPGNSSVPLIYPMHFDQGFISWPKTNNRKPNALRECRETRDLMVPAGIYTLVKRFSSKEERRRVVAAVCDSEKICSGDIGFENHLNYFHCNGQGLTSNLAKGLALFLNSSLVDQYFRQFNGHTQVNATDLRNLRYPTKKQLNLLGSRFKTQLPPQEKIDQLIDELLEDDSYSVVNVSAR